MLSPERRFHERRIVLPVAGKADRVNFNIMVIGEAGLGKSTFLQTLIDMNRWKDLTITRNRPEMLTRTVDIQQMGSYLYESNMGDVQFSFYDTPGYGDFIDNQQSLDRLHDELLTRIESWVSIDAQIITNKDLLLLDSRIHCCFYFISPHRFKEIDRQSIMKLSELTPIIPIISKSDQMTMDEKSIFLNEVHLEISKIAEMKEMYIYDVIYDFIEPSISTSENSTSNNLPSNIPNIFSIVSDPLYERSYPWGKCEVRYELHSDFMRLYRLLFESGLHIKRLRDVTQTLTIEYLGKRDEIKTIKLQKADEVSIKTEKTIKDNEEKKFLRQRVQELEFKIQQMDIERERSVRTFMALEKQLVAIKEEKGNIPISTPAPAPAPTLMKCNIESEKRLQEQVKLLKDELDTANAYIRKLRASRDIDAKKTTAVAVTRATVSPTSNNPFAYVNSTNSTTIDHNTPRNSSPTIMTTANGIDNFTTVSPTYATPLSNHGRSVFGASNAFNVVPPPPPSTSPPYYTSTSNNSY
eukprot:gene8258-16989_t